MLGLSGPFLVDIRCQIPGAKIAMLLKAFNQDI
jgi:hypothetical protein